MESKKGGGVLLVLAEVRLGTRSFSFFSFSNSSSQNGLERARGATRSFMTQSRSEVRRDRSDTESVAGRETGIHGWTLLLSEEQ